LYVAFVYVSAGETEAVNAYFKPFFGSNTFKSLVLLETKISGLSIHSFVKNCNRLGLAQIKSVHIDMCWKPRDGHFLLEAVVRSVHSKGFGQNNVGRSKQHVQKKGPNKAGD
jgi:hypothetical protein